VWVTTTQLCESDDQELTIVDDPGSQTVELIAYGADQTLKVTDLNNPTLTVADLANTILGPGVVASNIKFTGAPIAAGTFTGGTNVIGFDSGIILSDGSANNVIGPNCSSGITGINEQPGDTDLSNLIDDVTNDAAVLEFDFVPQASTLTFQYVWASDEYNEFVYSFNDVFGFFVNGTNIALVPGTDLPVSINDVNDGNPLGTNPTNPQFYLNNDFQYPTLAPFDTEMNGLTVVLTAQATVNPGVTNHIKLAVADAIDFVLDSNVFIKAASISSSQINLSPGTLGFGSQGLGATSSPQTVTVTNNGETAVTISNISASGDFAATNVNCPLSPSTLASAGTCSITVTFTPLASGLLNGTLTLTDNANGVAGSTQTVTLSGTGTGSGGLPVASLAPTALSYQHNLNLQCPSKPLILSNTGGSTLQISGITAAGSFAISANACGATLAPGANCEIDVSFTAESPVGVYSGTLTVSDNAAGSPQVVPLSGQVFPPCFLRSDAVTQQVLRSTPAATFDLSDKLPSCHTTRIAMACANNQPATCAFSPAAIAPGGSTVLSVQNLNALTTDQLSFAVTGTDSTNTSSVNLLLLLSDFTFTPYATTATVSAGQTATYALTLTPVNGLAGTIRLSCQGAPAGSTCTVTPAAVTLAANYPAQVSVAVSTSGGARGAPRGGAPWTGPGASLRLVMELASLLVLMGLAGWVVAGGRGAGAPGRSLARRRPCLSGLALAALALMLMAWAACGGGGMGNSVANPATPAGTYPLTVTGTYDASSGQPSGLTRNQALTLQVH